MGKILMIVLSFLNSYSLSDLRTESIKGSGDQRYIVMLKMNINPSLVCFFIQRYIMGKALWVCKNKDNDDKELAKIAGIKSVDDLYRNIKLRSFLFSIPMLEKQMQLEASGRLSDFVKNVLVDSSNELFGEYAAPLKVVIHGYAEDVQYGSEPAQPIQTGVIPGYVRELDYLEHIRDPNGERVSYHLIHSGCEENLNKKISVPAALLDEYEIKIKGTDKPVVLYFDAYHEDTLYCPKGFTFLN